MKPAITSQPTASIRVNCSSSRRLQTLPIARSTNSAQKTEPPGNSKSRLNNQTGQGILAGILPFFFIRANPKNVVRRPLPALNGQDCTQFSAAPATTLRDRPSNVQPHFSLGVAKMSHGLEIPNCRLPGIKSPVVHGRKGKYKEAGEMCHCPTLLHFAKVSLNNSLAREDALLLPWTLLNSRHGARR